MQSSSVVTESHRLMWNQAQSKRLFDLVAAWAKAKHALAINKNCSEEEYKILFEELDKSADNLFTFAKQYNLVTVEGASSGKT